MKAKRFLSILVAVLMMVSCFVVGASAAVVTKPDKGTLNIHLYEAANASDVALSDTDLSGTNADLDSSKTYKGIEGVTFTVVKVADDAADVASAAALTGADAYSVTTAATNAEGLTTAADLPAGRYKVTAASKPDYVGTPVPFLVDVPMTNPEGTGFNTTVDVYPKVVVTRDDPTVDKLVAPVVDKKEPDDADYTYLANLGYDQEASWRIEATVPTNIAQFNKYVLTDVISEDLVFVDGSIKVSEQPDGSYTAAYDSPTRTITVTLDPKQATPGKIVFKFRTTIKDNKPHVEIPNHVTLVYNDSTLETNPNYDPSLPEDDTNWKERPTEPDDKTNNWDNPDDYDKDTPGKEFDPYVWTGALKVIKVDDKGNKISTNEVEFELYKDDKTTLVTTLKTVDGEAYYTGLANGTYYLYETKAPAGYELNTVPVEVKIGDAFADAEVTVNFVNIPSTKLPLTGGMGVGIFALIGFAFAAVGGAFFFKSKKVSD